MSKTVTTDKFEPSTFKLISGKIGEKAAIAIAGMHAVQCTKATDARRAITVEWAKQYSRDQQKMKGDSVEMYHQFAALAVMLNYEPKHMKVVLDALKAHFEEKASSSEEKPLFDRFVQALLAEVDPKDFDKEIQRNFHELFKIESSSWGTDGTVKLKATDGDAVCELFRAFSLKVGSKSVDEKTAKELFESHFLIEKTKIIRSRIPQCGMDEVDSYMDPEGREGCVSNIVRKLLDSDWRKSSEVYKKLKSAQDFRDKLASAYNNLFYLQEVILGLFAISSWVSYKRFQNVLAGRVFLALSAVMSVFSAYNYSR